MHYLWILSFPEGAVAFACFILHNWAWLSACLELAGYWFVLLAVLGSDTSLQDINTLCTLVEDLSYAQGEVIQYCQKYLKSGVPAWLSWLSVC